MHKRNRESEVPNNMKISVIMVDGGFRENIHSARYFSQQDFPAEDYEILWVEYFDQPAPALSGFPKVNVITLGKTGEYHSSYCFNKGIETARGEVLVIVDADQIVSPGFLSRIWAVHSEYDRLAHYIFRYDEDERNPLAGHDFQELEKRCVLKNPTNYGGCLTVRKQWLVEINGYDMHPVFGSGFHANGLDIYTRLKNLGLAVRWDETLTLYHPWHPASTIAAGQYEPQKKLIQWRSMNRQYLALRGIDTARDFPPPPDLRRLLGEAKKGKAFQAARNAGTIAMDGLKRKMRRAIPWLGR